MTAAGSNGMRSSELGASKEPLSNAKECGFVILPDVISAGRLTEIGAAYDRLMTLGSGGDFRIGSTTTRLYFTDNKAEFEDIYHYPPLLNACRAFIGEPFRLSALLGRTVRPGSSAQDLHADIERTRGDESMAGFILMLDSFTQENGATRFVPGSHDWPDFPSDRSVDPSQEWEGEVLACGDAGSIIVFHAGIWHGHTANSTFKARRSIQGYFVRSGESR